MTETTEEEAKEENGRPSMFNMLKRFITQKVWDGEGNGSKPL